MEDDPIKYLHQPTKRGFKNPIGHYIVSNSLRENDILKRLREVSKLKILNSFPFGPSQAKLKGIKC